MLLALTCAGLLAVILLELDKAPLSRVARSMPSQVADQAPVVDLEADDLEFEMPPLSLYSDIASRPLFSPTRRPQAPEEMPSAEEEPSESADLVLRGVAIVKDNRIALLAERASGELVRAVEGQTVGGWQVTAINRRTVELEARGDKLVLEVGKDSSPPMRPELAPKRRLLRTDPLLGSHRIAGRERTNSAGRSATNSP